MADQPAAAPPDLTPAFLILLIIVIAGLGSIRSCGTPQPVPRNGNGAPVAGGGCAGTTPDSQTMNNSALSGGGCYGPVPTTANGSYQLTRNFNYYTIVVGRFGTPQEASSFMAELRSRNIDNFILQTTDGQFLICVGKQLSAGRTGRLLNTLRDRGYNNLIILPPQTQRM